MAMNAVATRLEAIRAKGDLSFADVAVMLNTTPETVSRWRNGHREPRRTTEKDILELEFFINELAEIYDPKEARLFMFSPQKLLGGETPAKMIETGRMSDVRKLVNQIRDTVYL